MSTLADRFHKAYRISATHFWHAIPCWDWMRGLSKSGYGKLHPGRAHRIAWALYNGPIPDGLLVLHHCDRPCCVNPEHLFLGTPLDNIRDMDAKGRRKDSTPKNPRHGEGVSLAKLTAEQVTAIFLAAGTQESIAREFNVTQTTISRIKAGVTWVRITRAL